MLQYIHVTIYFIKKNYCKKISKLIFSRVHMNKIISVKTPFTVKNLIQ